MNRLEKRLLNDFQRQFPLCPRPFAEIAARLGVSEQEVIDGLGDLCEVGAVSRVGPVFRPGHLGASTLAAMAVPRSRLDQVAAIVSSYPEVNHNYEREHYYNLWFVAIASSEVRLRRVLLDIQRLTRIPVLALPMLQDYHIDLGFELQWEDSDTALRAEGYGD